MCSTVWFLYSCGCVEAAVFQCLDEAALRPRGRAVCHEGRVKPMLTTLDEECHDCSRDPGLLLLLSASPPPVDVLRERDVNVPTDDRAPSPGADLSVALVESAA
ncbi:hypothetical protein F4820DRAFT_127073 [Hypoxylon rubiginosum]|uniref:Uncharacterized protein n=1 Tax=Hypoxylon rubiginosum TaxID=110542 RepID=A0ACB9ZBI1_9PEZI|nr:hypothetical protein F4820DRAFT_127073 [Hypoxylon rubiginosum]